MTDRGGSRRPFADIYVPRRYRLRKGPGADQLVGNRHRLGQREIGVRRRVEQAIADIVLGEPARVLQLVIVDADRRRSWQRPCSRS